jgi:uncharacterized membrane protein YhaH (DUF805 family)
MDETDTETPSFLATLFDPKGRITPGQYWVAIVICLLLLPCILLFMAMGSDPRGTDGPLVFVLPLLGIFLWLFITAMVKRLRDAGKHPALALVFLLLFLVTAAFVLIVSDPIEVGLVFVLIMFLGLLFFIGHIETMLKRRDPDAA